MYELAFPRASVATPQNVASPCKYASDTQTLRRLATCCCTCAQSHGCCFLLFSVFRSSRSMSTCRAWLSAVHGNTFPCVWSSWLNRLEGFGLQVVFVFAGKHVTGHVPPSCHFAEPKEQVRKVVLYICVRLSCTFFTYGSFFCFCCAPYRHMVGHLPRCFFWEI